MGKCLICNDYTYPKFRLHCRDHYFHKSCIKIEHSSIFKNCEYCYSIFLENAQFINCSSCSSILPEIKKSFICPKFNAFCIPCYSQNVDLQHVKDCKNCQKYLEAELWKCDSCSNFSQRKDLQKVPKCNDHYFCKSCLKHKLKSSWKLDSNCRGYFLSIERKGFSRDICNICVEPGDNSLGSCILHIYCDECMKFIHKENCLEFPNIMSCPDCSEYIKNLKFSISFCEAGKLVPEMPTFSQEKQSIKANYHQNLRNTPKLTCSSEHVYTEKDLKQENFRDLPTKCANCFNLLVNYECLSNCIICKKNNSIIPKNRCGLYANICQNCAFPQIEIEHVRKCGECRRNFVEKIKSCNFCHELHENTVLYQVPQCKKHVFCEQCLAKGMDMFHRDKFCKSCLGYFENNCYSKYTENKCNLCIAKGEKRLENCQKHVYCYECFIFASTNRASLVFPKVKNCKDCTSSVCKINSGFEEEKKSFRAFPNELAHQKPLKCPSGHIFTVNQLSLAEYNFNLISTCQQCEKLLLQVPTLRFCIYCKSEKIRSLSYDSCDNFLNICENCFYIHVEPGHIKTCRKCQNISKNFIKNCSGCFIPELESLLLQVPRCEKHYFCLDCLSEKKNKSIRPCEKCMSYFENIGKFNEMGCNVCSLGSDIRLNSCNRHGYCRKCFEFITGKGFEWFPNVNNCADCVVGIKSKAKPDEFQNNPTEPLPQVRLYPIIDPNSYQMDPTALSVSENKLNYSNEIPDLSKLYIETNVNSPLAPCSNCFTTNSHCNFQCNHSFCIECLVFNCSQEIMNFFKNYEIDNSISNSKFQYFCPVPYCGNILNIPTQMIFIEIRKIISQVVPVRDMKRFSEVYGNLKYLDSCDLSVWIPYFDGIKFNLVFKTS